MRLRFCTGSVFQVIFATVALISFAGSKNPHATEKKQLIISISPRIRNNIDIDCTAYLQSEQGCTPKRGIYKSYLEVMGKSLNVSFHIIPSSAKGSTGIQLPNGTWMGTVADVLYNTADLGVAAQTVSRNGAVHYSAPITTEFVTFVTRKPARLFSWKALVCPFSPVLWLSCFLALVVGILVISILSSKTFFIYGSTVSGENDDGMTVVEVILFCLGSFLEEPMEICRRVSVQIMCGFWLIFAINISIAYRAKLLPCLGFPMTRDLPTSFEQLVASEYQWGFVSYGGAALNYLKTTDNPTYRKLYERMTLETDIRKCLQKCLGGPPFACVGYKTLFDVTIYSDFTDQHGQHDLVVSPAVTLSIPVGLIMQKTSEGKLGPKLDRIIHFVQCSGLPGQWEKLDFVYLRSTRQHSRQVTEGSGPSQVVVLRLEQMTGAVYIGIIGILIALATFAAEVSSEYRRGLGQKQKNKEMISQWKDIYIFRNSDGSVGIGKRSTLRKYYS